MQKIIPLVQIISNKIDFDQVTTIVFTWSKSILKLNSEFYYIPVFYGVLFSFGANEAFFAC